MSTPYALGGPVWSLADWIGVLYRRGSSRSELLSQYGQVFNAVEGNTTFYGTPTLHTAERWRRDTPDGFQFCFKLPKIVTHDIRLREHCWGHLREFFDGMAPLGPRLGPFMIQLPARFSPTELDILEAFLRRLPTGHAYAVEVRHPGFYAGGRAERALDMLLEKLGVDRVIFDTRGLRDDDSASPAIRRTLARKPNLRWKPVATGPRPLIRFCGHSEIERNGAYVDEWTDRIDAWIGEGRRPFFFVHTPGDLQVPQLARRFHEGLRRLRPDLAELPAFPAEGGQLSLL